MYIFATHVCLLLVNVRKKASDSLGLKLQCWESKLVPLEEQLRLSTPSHLPSPPPYVSRQSFTESGPGYLGWADQPLKPQDLPVSFPQT